MCFLHSEVAGGVEDPQQRGAKISCAAGASAFQPFENGGEILLAIEADADRDINFRVQHGLFFQSLHQAVCNEFVIVRTTQVRAYFLECHQEALKIGVVVKGLDLGERRMISVIFVKLE